MLIAPLSIKVTGASLDLAKPVSVALDTKINDTGTLNVAGEITPQPVAANLNLKLDGIELAAIQPYIAQYTSMTLLAGRLGGDAKVRYGAQKPALQFSGNLSVAGLHTVDNALHQDFINWDRLDIQGLNFQHDPDRLDIDQITARKLYARVIIEPDESMNVKRILTAPGATVVAPSGDARPPLTATAAPAPAPPLPHKGRKSAAAPHRALRRARQRPRPDRRCRCRSRKSCCRPARPISPTCRSCLTSPPASRSSKEPCSGFPQKKIPARRSIFMDRWMSSRPSASPARSNVLSAALYTDLAMSFRNIELSTFNPYSGKFAGYNISKGKLTTELHYKVDGRKLDAQHHIIVEQLEFGDKTESKDAVSLPVKLAVALLKDRDGVIDLNLPVTGSLDDPKFKLGPIIWKVFVNILEKAVTAPFALLGSLFGGGPDLQFVDFQPGDAKLDPVGVAKAQSIVKALDARPQLKIEIPIAVVERTGSPESHRGEVSGAAPRGAGCRGCP